MLNNYKTFALMIEPAPNEARAVVTARLFDDGTVGLIVNGVPIGIDQDIVLRWEKRPMAVAG